MVDHGGYGNKQGEHGMQTRGVEKLSNTKGGGKRVRLARLKGMEWHGVMQERTTADI